MLCLGNSNIASHIYSRFFKTIKMQALTVQAIVKGLICFVGLFIFSAHDLFFTSLGMQCACIVIGFFLGMVVVRVELKINRFVQRRSDYSVRGKQYVESSFIVNPVVSSIATRSVHQSKSHLKDLHDHYVSQKRTPSFSLITIIMIALFEEILFRGYLVKCCFLLPIACNEALIATVIVFGLSHSSGGVHQMVSKALLGSVCLLCVCIFHALLPALIIHGFFNWRAYVYSSIAL